MTPGISFNHRADILIKNMKYVTQNTIYMHKQHSGFDIVNKPPELWHWFSNRHRPIYCASLIFLNKMNNFLKYEIILQPSCLMKYVFQPNSLYEATKTHSAPKISPWNIQQILVLNMRSSCSPSAWKIKVLITSAKLKLNFSESDLNGVMLQSTFIILEQIITEAHLCSTACVSSAGFSGQVSPWGSEVTEKKETAFDLSNTTQSLVYKHRGCSPLFNPRRHNEASRKRGDALM